MPIVTCNDDAECAICQELKAVDVIWEIEPPCGHSFHQSCLLQWLNTETPNTTCPICRRGISAAERVNIRNASSGALSTRISHDFAMSFRERTEEMAGESSRAREFSPRVNNAVPRASTYGPSHGGMVGESSRARGVSPEIINVVPRASTFGPSSTRIQRRNHSGPFSLIHPVFPRQDRDIFISIARPDQPIQELRFPDTLGPPELRTTWGSSILQAWTEAFENHIPRIPRDSPIRGHAVLLIMALADQRPRSRIEPSPFQLIEAFTRLIDGVPVSIYIGGNHIFWNPPSRPQ